MVRQMQNPVHWAIPPAPRSRQKHRWYEVPNLITEAGNRVYLHVSKSCLAGVHTFPDLDKLALDFLLCNRPRRQLKIQHRDIEPF